MTTITRPALSMAELTEEVERVRQEIEAISVLVADASGNLLTHTPPSTHFELGTLAALGVANLLATREMMGLIGNHSTDDEPQFLLLEGKMDGLMLCGAKNHLLFIAVLGRNTILGLARMELRRLASIECAELSSPESLGALSQQLLDALEGEW